jgi:arginine decarboxylase
MKATDRDGSAPFRYNPFRAAWESGSVMNDITHDPREIYAVDRWSDGYFDIVDGRVHVRPGRDGPGAALDELARSLPGQDLKLPVLLRFKGILRDRVDALCDAFERARKHDGFRGAYTAVYPIKVNQQRAVVEEIVSHGGQRVGLEAGSKPELMAVLGIASPGSVIVCNGYKDREYLRLALIGQRIGHRVYVVIEKLSELDALIREAEDMRLRPRIGVRIRLASVGAGNWQNTGGEKSKFGLSATQVLAAVERLRAAGMTDCLELLHFHLGSQLANIRDIQRGLREAVRHYAELHHLGVPVKVMDVGGGLGVDYEGTGSRSYCSMNYSVQQYAQAIVRAMWEICTECDLPHPDLITESGRALTAHHAVLVSNIIDVESVSEEAPEAPADDAPLILHDLWEGLQETAGRSPVEAYHDALHWLSEVQAMYVHGVLDLHQRAHAERIYQAICRRVRSRLDPTARNHREILDELNEKLALKLFTNMSVFQSLPDVWAIEQVFPILPLVRLDEPLSQRALVRDLTCDSDGRIDHYVDRNGLEATLPVPALRGDGSDLLGFFMVGAYQEILGDMHNLFGDTDSVNVEIEADGSFRFAGGERGDSIDELLRYVHFDPEELLTSYRGKIAAAGLTAEEAEACLGELQDGLVGYTYLEP